MGDFRYTIRNYRPSDFNKFVLLNVEAEQLEPAGRSISPQVIAEGLERPGHSPGQDLFVVEIAGNIAGYMDVTQEKAIGRVVLNCWVHPQHRRRGLAAQLLSRAMQRARESGARIAHSNIAENNKVARRVLTRLGFQRVRRFWELALELNEVLCQDIDRNALDYHHLISGEEEKLVNIQNRAFAGTWGYKPNTVEEIVYRTSLSHRSPEDVITIVEGDRITGYCWLGIVDAGGATVGEREGRIFMLGSDPDYRRKGVGRMALLAGLSALKNKGLRTVGLTVDSQNKIACALYRSVGFKVGGRSLWYEKTVD